MASSSEIQRAVEILRNGGIVAHATETCYGLACDLQNPEAIKRLFMLKDRPGTMPVSALFLNIDQAKQYVEWNDTAENLAKRYLPGPLTLILPKKPDANIHVTVAGDDDAIGIRISPHPTAMALVEAFGSPLSTTSANVHSEPSPASAQEIQKQYEGRELVPDFIIDDGVLNSGSDGSTVADVRDGAIKVVRQGKLQIS